MSFRVQFWKPKTADKNQKADDKTGGEYFYASEDDEEEENERWKMAGAMPKRSLKAEKEAKAKADKDARERVEKSRAQIAVPQAAPEVPVKPSSKIPKAAAKP